VLGMQARTSGLARVTSLSNEHRQRVGGGSLSCGGLDRGSSIEALPGLDGLSVSSRNGLPSRGYHGHVPELR
jgi:hypothetical protein